LPSRRRLAARLKPILRPAIRLFRLRRERLPLGARGVLTQNFSATYLRKALEGSLRRLRTDYVDLFQLHSPPEEIVLRGEWEAELDALKRSGKIRYYGVSCDTIGAGMAALGFAQVSSVQFLVNLIERGAVSTLLPELRARSVAGIARECLANGLLAKPANQIDLERYYAFADERLRRKKELDEYRAQAAESGRTLGKLALDYVSSLEGVSVTLVGARTVEQLRALVG
jgi:aryl-alcohol dehydrogenase-like predicted oxidoreductase